MTATVDAGTRRVTTAKAISEGIAQEMRSNPDVFVMGEDVGPYGGIFGSTGGLYEEFGSTRIIDTPISETGFIGAGIGAAVEGLRPVVELMFVDFFGVCFDQIYNHMAKIHYESGGNVKVPMVSDDGRRWWLLRCRAALPMPVGHVRAHAGYEDRGAVEPLRRQGIDDLSDPR